MWRIHSTERTVHKHTVITSRPSHHITSHHISSIASGSSRRSHTQRAAGHFPPKQQITTIRAACCIRKQRRPSPSLYRRRLSRVAELVRTRGGGTERRGRVRSGRDVLLRCTAGTTRRPADGSVLVHPSTHTPSSSEVRPSFNVPALRALQGRVPHPGPRPGVVRVASSTSASHLLGCGAYNA